MTSFQLREIIIPNVGRLHFLVELLIAHISSWIHDKVLLLSL